MLGTYDDVSKSYVLSNNYLGNFMFKNLTSLKVVTFAADTKKINVGAFFNCYELVTANFNAALETIDDWSFYNCKLTKVDLRPTMVSVIGEQVFREDDFITHFYYSNYVFVIEPYTFYKCISLKVISLPQPVVGQEAVTGLRAIGTRAFAECPQLGSATTDEETIVVPSSIQYDTAEYAKFDNDLVHADNTKVAAFKSIKEVTAQGVRASAESRGLGDYIFSGSGLVKVIVNSYILGAYMFDNCTRLEEVKLSSNIKSISASCFNHCERLKSINFKEFQNDTVRYNQVLTMLGVDSLDSFVDIPGSVVEVQDYAFNYCKSLKYVDIPATVKKVGYYVFAYNENLLSATVRTAKLGNYMFAHDGKLTTVAINNSVEDIPIGCFYNCESLTSMFNVANIGQAQTAGVLSIPDGVRGIGDEAFRNCKGFKELILPLTLGVGKDKYSESYITDPEHPVNSNGKIGKYTFANDESLQTVTIKGALLGEYMFSNCSSLETVTIENGIPTDSTATAITTIPKGAFYRCIHLVSLNSDHAHGDDSININDSITTIQEQAFAQSTAFTTLVLPDGLTQVAEGAFSGCKGMTSATLPFIGKNRGTSADASFENLFGYIFGSTSYYIIQSSTYVDQSGITRDTADKTKYVGVLYGTNDIEQLILDTVTSHLHAYVTGVTASEVSPITSTTKNAQGVRVFSVKTYWLEQTYYPSHEQMVHGDIDDYYTVSTTVKETYNSTTGIYTIDISTTATRQYRNVGDVNYTYINDYKPLDLSPSFINNVKYTYKVDEEFNVTRQKISDVVTSAASGDKTGVTSSVETIDDNPTTTDLPTISNGITLVNILTRKTVTDTVVSGSSKYVKTYIENLIPRGLTTINIKDEDYVAYGAFYNIATLQEVSLNSEIIEIGDYAFYLEDNTASSIKAVVPYDANGMTYTVDNGITIPTSTTRVGHYAFYNFVLPKTLKLSNVVTIGDYAFYNAKAVENTTIGGLVIPTTTTKIGEYAFAHLESLRKLTINKNANDIGKRAFEYDIKLLEVIAENHYISDYMFYCCYELESFYSQAEKAAITDATLVNSTSGINNKRMVIIGLRFDEYVVHDENAPGETAAAKAGKIKDTLDTNEEVWTNCHIGTHAFANCYGIKTKTGENTYVVNPFVYPTYSSTEANDENMSGIANISIEVTYVTEFLFYSDRKIHYVYISKDVTDIGRSAFAKCYGLRTAEFAQDDAKDLTIHEFAFQETYINIVDLPDRTIYIGEGVFKACENVGMIEVPFIGSERGNNSVPGSVFGWIFGRRFDPNASYIDDNVTIYERDNEYNIIDDAETLAKVSSAQLFTATQQGYNEIYHKYYYIPAKLKVVNVTGENMVARGAFYNCINIEHITFAQDKLENVLAYAFYNCQSLKEIEIPDQISSISANTFQYCGSLEWMKLPFVGTTAANNGYGRDNVFGVIFGTLEFPNDSSYAANQLILTENKDSSGNYIPGEITYYIPKNLKMVIISNTEMGKLSYGAFSNITSIEHLSITGNVMTTVEDFALFNTTSLVNSQITVLGTDAEVSSFDATGVNGVVYKKTYDSTNNPIPYEYHFEAEIVGTNKFELPTQIDTFGDFVFANIGTESTDRSGYYLNSGVTKAVVDAYRTTHQNNATSAQSGANLTNTDTNNNRAKMVNLVLPQRLATIGNYAFNNLSKIETLVIPANVTQIGVEALYGCNK